MLTLIFCRCVPPAVHLDKLHQQGGATGSERTDHEYVVGGRQLFQKHHSVAELKRNMA